MFFIYSIHSTAAVGTWLAEYPRFELIFLPTYRPEANPIERAFGDAHDTCTRNHRRKRIERLVKDVERHLESNDPWKYKLGRVYYEQEVTAAMANIVAEPPLEQAA